MAEAPPSPLRAALRLLLHTVRHGGQGSASRASAPHRKLAAERQAMVVEASRCRRYLAVTGGSAISGLHEDGAPLPPTYPALWQTALALELLGSGEAVLPVRGLIHRDSELISLRPLFPEDRIRCRVELDRVEPRPRGVYLTLKCRNWNGAGQLCQENTFGLLVRTPGEGSDEGAPAGEIADAAEWRELATWTLPGDLGRRYARVSGDYNPIHLWPWSARPLGFPRPILHGYCTEAMVAHTLIERLLGGDPNALRRLRTVFRAPLALPARVRLLYAPKPGGSGGRYRIVDAVEDRGRPYAEGEFVGGAG